MKLPLQETLVPPHIDGFVVQTDLRVSRFSAVGLHEREGGQVAEHSRAELELNLVLHGRAQLLLAGQRVVLEPQHMLWIRPRQNRLVIDASSDFLGWVLVFRPRLLRRVCTTASSAPLKEQGGREVLLRRLSRPEVRTLSQLYAALPVGAGRDVFNAGLGYALTRSWLSFQAAPAARLPEEVHPAVRQAAWLLRDGHTSLSNTALSAQTGLSTHRLKSCRKIGAERARPQKKPQEYSRISRIFWQDESRYEPFFDSS